MQTQLLPKHLYSLDVLRGIAALAVVFWHWKHFLVYGTGLDLEFINFPELDYDRQPLFPLLSPSTVRVSAPLTSFSAYPVSFSTGSIPIE